MKKFTILTVFTLLYLSSIFSQINEFTTYDNGLIYSEPTMIKLAAIADSLNLKYKSCDLNKVFYSKAQGKGHIVSIEDQNSKKAYEDIKGGISYNDFKTKYQKADLNEDALIVRFIYKNYEKKEIVEFSEINLGNGYGKEIKKVKNLEKYKGDMAKGWIFSYEEKSEYSDEFLLAIYLPDGLTNARLKDEYAKMIGYSECLIDSSSPKMHENQKYGLPYLPENWKNLSLKELEETLDDLRSTKVVGQCSQDNSPRLHAINIALVSAETAKWEVFLKAHLDIMNDRFDRMSDGSYAWNRRKTYIKELEELDINVTDLLLGITLRIDNSSEHHYYGSISRLGRALTESENNLEIETEIFKMIEDPELDDYNRIIAHFLALNYYHYMEDNDKKVGYLNQLKKSVRKLPKYISSKIDMDKIGK